MVFTITSGLDPLEGKDEVRGCGPRRNGGGSTECKRAGSCEGMRWVPLKVRWWSPPGGRG